MENVGGVWTPKKVIAKTEILAMEIRWEMEHDFSRFFNEERMTNFTGEFCRPAALEDYEGWLKGYVSKAVVQVFYSLGRNILIGKTQEGMYCKDQFQRFLIIMALQP